jgi:hypothetical protein
MFEQLYAVSSPVMVQMCLAAMLAGFVVWLSRWIFTIRWSDLAGLAVAITLLVITVRTAHAVVGISDTTLTNPLKVTGFAWAEQKHRFGPSLTQYVQVNISQDNRPFGAYLFWDAGPGGWNQYLAGPTVRGSIKSVYTEIGVCGGIEHLDGVGSRFRSGGYILLLQSHGTFMLTGDQTRGEPGWWRGQATYVVVPSRLELGVHGERYFGLGPMIRFTADKVLGLQPQFWVSGSRMDGEASVIIAFQLAK